MVIKFFLSKVFPQSTSFSSMPLPSSCFTNSRSPWNTRAGTLHFRKWETCGFCRKTRKLLFLCTEHVMDSGRYFFNAENPDCLVMSWGHNRNGVCCSMEDKKAPFSLPWNGVKAIGAHLILLTCVMQRCQELVVNPSVCSELKLPSATAGSECLSALTALNHCLSFLWATLDDLKKNPKPQTNKIPLDLLRNSSYTAFLVPASEGSFPGQGILGAVRELLLFSVRTGNQIWVRCYQVLFYCLLKNWKLICYPCKSPANYGLVVKRF